MKKIENKILFVCLKHKVRIGKVKLGTDISHSFRAPRRGVPHINKTTPSSFEFHVEIRGASVLNRHFVVNRLAAVILFKKMSSYFRIFFMYVRMKP